MFEKIMQPIPNNADPDILHDGADYYLVSAIRSGELTFRGFQVYHSTDVTHWSEPRIVLDFKDFPWANAMGWAPSLRKFRDKYYLAFCADQQIGLAVSDSPFGPFRDAVGAPLVKYNEFNNQTIDPCLFVDGDELYLFWGQGKCWLSKLDVDNYPACRAEEPTLISAEFYWQSSSPLAFDGTIYNEAPDVIKIGDKYLLTWSIYDYRDARYSVRYAWADNVYGPYIQPRGDDMELDNILKKGHGSEQGTGHACVVEYEGEYYLFYHRLTWPRQGYLRETCRGKIEFLPDGKLRMEA